MSEPEASSESEATPESQPVSHFITVEDPRAYATEARQQGKFVVWVPRSVRSKETLLKLFAAALRFPRYFRRNWDAFEECICDLHWLPENLFLCIVHEQLPFGEGENLHTYGDVLENAATNRTDKRRIEVVYPE